MGNLRYLEVKIRQIIWSIYNTFKVHTGDRVHYKGDIYFVKSSLTGWDKWDLHFQNDKAIHYNIEGSKLKVIHSLNRFKCVFISCLEFQRINWQSIDLSKKLGSRLSYKNSDNIAF